MQFWFGMHSSGVSWFSAPKTVIDCTNVGMSCSWSGGACGVGGETSPITGCFIRLLFDNILYRFDNWCKWRLNILYVPRLAWTFGRGCDCQIRWRIIEAIVTTATKVSIWRSFGLCSWICWCGRWCRLRESWLLAMGNSDFFLLLIRESMEIGNFGNAQMAREMFDLEDNTPLPGSRLRCFIFLSPLIFLVNCSIWLWICSSTNFLPVFGPRLSA